MKQRERRRQHNRLMRKIKPKSFWRMTKESIQKGVEAMAKMPSKLAAMKERIEQARAKVRTPEHVARLQSAELRFEECLKKYADRLRQLEQGGTIGTQILARIKERQAEYEHAQAQAPQGT